MVVKLDCVNSFFFFFFFSSRRRHTRYWRDWSSDVCSSDLPRYEALTIPAVVEHLEGIVGELDRAPIIMGHSAGGLFTQILRSEERRVGKECRSRWSPYH